MIRRNDSQKRRGEEEIDIIDSAKRDPFQSSEYMMITQGAIPYNQVHTNLYSI